MRPWDVSHRLHVMLVVSYTCPSIHKRYTYHSPPINHGVSRTGPGNMQAAQRYKGQSDYCLVIE